LPDVQRVAVVPAAQRDPAGSDQSYEERLQLGRYVAVLWRHRFLIIVLTAAGAIAGLLASAMKPTMYEASATLMVVPPARNDLRPGAIANSRALLENLSLAGRVSAELGLDRPPLSYTAQRFLESAVSVDELRGTNLVRLRVKLPNPQTAMQAAQSLSHKAVALNSAIATQDGIARRDQLKAELDDAAGRLRTAEQALLEYQSTAQVELLKRDTDAMLDERGDLLKLLVEIEGEKARLAAAEAELGKHRPILAVPRLTAAEEALRHAPSAPPAAASRPLKEAAENADVSPDRLRQADRASADKPAAGGSALGDTRKSAEKARTPASAQTSVPRGQEGQADPEALDLTDPYVNPVYQTLTFQIATSRARLALLERQRHELVDVKKLGGPESQQLRELYARQMELERRQTTYDLARKVYSDLSMRYDESRTEVLGTTPQLQVIDEAVLPDRPLPRKRLQTILLGLVVGFLLATLASIVLDGTGAGRRVRFS
jgi:capsule polysaccharide export protein KpsE/RkpR